MAVVLAAGSERIQQSSRVDALETPLGCCRNKTPSQWSFWAKSISFPTVWAEYAIPDKEVAVAS